MSALNEAEKKLVSQSDLLLHILVHKTWLATKFINEVGNPELHFEYLEMKLTSTETTLIETLLCMFGR